MVVIILGSSTIADLARLLVGGRGAQTELLLLGDLMFFSKVIFALSDCCSSGSGENEEGESRVTDLESSLTLQE